MITATLTETRNDAKMYVVLRAVNAALLNGWSIEFCDFAFSSYWFALFTPEGHQAPSEGSLYAVLQSAFLAVRLGLNDAPIVVDNIELYLEVEKLVKDAAL